MDDYLARVMLARIGNAKYFVAAVEYRVGQISGLDDALANIKAVRNELDQMVDALIADGAPSKGEA